jgi:endo-1,4-beta-xylanase
MRIDAPGQSLRALAEKRGIRIGAAVAVRPLRDDPVYRELLAREFNIVTSENALKFAPLRPTRERFDFSGADEIVAFARDHAMQVRGHTLVWHQALPAWLTNGNFGRDELTAILKDHIATVVGRYRGQIGAWDVVNEAVARDGSMRDTFWRRAVGDEYLEVVFRWAHEADPQARLFYNDFDGEGLNQKAGAIYNLVKGLLNRGVPVHGVGLQMHIGLDAYPQPQHVAANINRLAALGLEVHITEMDVKIQNGTGTMEERLAAQARIYRDMLKACLQASNFKAFVMWGVTDRYSWIPRHTGKPDAPLILDESARPKPAYHALLHVLGGQSSQPRAAVPHPGHSLR